MADIFDRLTDVLDEEKEDIFGEIEREDSAIENIKNQVATLLEQFDSKGRRNDNRKLSDEMKEFIREEIAKIKPKQNVIEKTIQTKVIEPKYIHVEPKVFHVEPKVIEAPPQIIKEVRVEVQTEKKDQKKYVEESKYLDLLVKISKLEGQIKETRRMAESPIVVNGGSGVIGIPPPEPNPEGHVLTVSKGKAAWAAATGSGGIPAGTFTISNNTPEYILDPTASSVDTLYQIVATLIRELQGEI